MKIYIHIYITLYSRTVQSSDSFVVLFIVISLTISVYRNRARISRDINFEGHRHLSPLTLQVVGFKLLIIFGQFISSRLARDMVGDLPCTELLRAEQNKLLGFPNFQLSN
jgi:hypothetical protein